MVACNYSISQDQCTLETCCLAQGDFTYIPNLTVNIFFAAFFAILVIPQLVLGIVYRTWGFGIAVIIGLLLEVAGYVARIKIHYDPFSLQAFVDYLVLLTIAPIFISAGIYLCMSRIIVVFGENNSRFSPRVIAVGFMISDFLSLFLQAAGGAIAASSLTGSGNLQMGVDIMIAGLIMQAVSLTTFLAFAAAFALSCRRSGALDPTPERRRLRRRPLFRAFLAILLLAAVTILVRSIFRVAELWYGFSSSLANDQWAFVSLDGVMVSTASLALTLVHPGVGFGGQWAGNNWTFKKRRQPSTKEMSPA